MLEHCCLITVAVQNQYLLLSRTRSGVGAVAARLRHGQNRSFV